MAQADDLPPFACAFFFDARAARVLLHLRDDEAPVNPGRWGFLGGTAEANESAIECILRELREEIEFDAQPGDLRALRSYVNPRSGRQRDVFVIERPVDPATTPLHEGAAIAWHSREGALLLDLTEPTRDDLAHFWSHAASSGTRRE